MYQSKLNSIMAGIRIPMQFFAEADPTGGGAGGAPPNDPPSGITLEQVFSAFKPEDILGSESMKQVLQSYTQTAVNQAKEQWEQENLDNLDEAKKLEKMSAAEREKYKFNKEKLEFEKEKKAFEHSQLEVSVGSELQKRGLPAEFSKFLTADNAENSKAQIDEFETAFNNAVSNAVNEKLRGTPPKGGSNNPPEKKMSLAEAMAYKNAHPDADIKTLI